MSEIQVSGKQTKLGNALTSYVKYNLNVSLTKSRYLCSNIFKGRFVLGKYITPESGKTGISFGSLLIIFN